MKVLSLMGVVLLCLAAQSVHARPEPAEQPKYILMFSPKQASVAPTRAADEKDSLLPRSPAMKNLLGQALAGNSIEPSERPLLSAAVPLVIDLKKGSLRRGAGDRPGPPAGPENVPAAVEVKSQNPARFDIQAQDETLYRALRRWSANGGHRLVWDAGVDFPARDTAYAATELNQAIDMVMADTQRSSYPLHACWYPNQVIHILHVSQACQKQ